jgi:hypothetical protein
MSQLSVVGVLSLHEIAQELFIHLHFAGLRQKLKWQFHGQLIFHAPDFHTHLNAPKLVANLAQHLALIQI